MKDFNEEQCRHWIWVRQTQLREARWSAENHRKIAMLEEERAAEFEFLIARLEQRLSEIAGDPA